jgi:integrase
MLALGKYPNVSLATARKLRDEARSLLKAGKHPVREKKINKLRQAYEGEITFEKIAPEWLEKKFEALDSRYKKHSLSRMEKYVFPEIGLLPLKEITIPHIVRMIDKISAKGVADIATRRYREVG